MRDDILKRVPVPPAMRTWARRASREADSHNGRSRVALENALHAECSRDISSDFRKDLRRLCDILARPTLSKDPMSWIRNRPGGGGLLEHHVRNKLLQILQRGLVGTRDLHSRIRDFMVHALRDRIEGYIRAFEVLSHPDRDPKARRMIDQMRGDLASVDLNVIANDHLGDGRNRHKQFKMQAVSPDEDLLCKTANSRAPRTSRVRPVSTGKSGVPGPTLEIGHE